MNSVEKNIIFQKKKKKWLGETSISRISLDIEGPILMKNLLKPSTIVLKSEEKITLISKIKEIIFTIST